MDLLCHRRPPHAKWFFLKRHMQNGSKKEKGKIYNCSVAGRRLLILHAMPVPACRTRSKEEQESGTCQRARCG
jgi:hypothetical protein